MAKFTTPRGGGVDPKGSYNIKGAVVNLDCKPVFPYRNNSRVREEGRAFMRENTEFSQGAILRENFAVLLGRSFFAGALKRGICPRQDRPHCRPVLNLSQGADEQVGSMRSCLVQSRLGELYTHSE
jgi:hypothetical protein